MIEQFKRVADITQRTADRYGVKAAIYCNFRSFDVLTEHKSAGNGCAWIKHPAGDFYDSPARLARKIRSEIKGLWA